MRSSLAARAVVACAFALGVASCKKMTVKKADAGPLPEPKVVILDTHGCQVKVTLEPEQARIDMATEPYLTFRAVPDCDRALTLGVGEMGNDLGRPETYSVSAVDDEGANVTIRDVTNGQGGATGHAAFTREKPLVQRLAVSQWLAFPHPGRYEIKVRKDLAIGERRDGGELDQDWLPVKISTFVDVER